MKNLFLQKVNNYVYHFLVWTHVVQSLVVIFPHWRLFWLEWKSADIFQNPVVQEISIISDRNGCFSYVDISYRTVIDSSPKWCSRRSITGSTRARVWWANSFCGENFRASCTSRSMLMTKRAHKNSYWSPSDEEWLQWMKLDNT